MGSSYSVVVVIQRVIVTLTRGDVGSTPSCSSCLDDEVAESVFDVDTTRPVDCVSTAGRVTTETAVDPSTIAELADVRKPTGWAKKVNPKCSTHNFVKYWPILKVLSLLQSPENLQCSGH